MEKHMKSTMTSIAFFAVAVVVAAAFFGVPGKAFLADSGQRNFAQVSVEPAVDYANGSTVYLLTPIKAPFPSKANPIATAPLYLPVYPITSTVPAFDLNCQPTNCDHVNVLPFLDADYGSASAQACADFNGGNPCSQVEGHDHLVGVPTTQGDFNVAWHVKLVFFTHGGFVDHAINTRITTLSQLTTLSNHGDIIIADTPITFNCSITSGRTYDLGTPVVIPFP
jgi:hypothetical protein